MANSTTGSASRKLHADFPLTERQSDGRYCKKVRGKIYYFPGSKQEALDEWLRVKDYLLAGEESPAKDDTGLTVKLLIDSFPEHKEKLQDSGELAPRTFGRYLATGKMLADFFGRHKLASPLMPRGFQSLRADMAKRLGPIALGAEIQIVRSIFVYGLKNELLDKPAKFGVDLKNHRQR